MDLKEKLIEEYLNRCRIICREGYSKLDYQRENIKKYILGYFIDGHNKEKISELVNICDKTLFDFLDIEMSRGRRTFGWPNFHEKEMKRLLNNALQTI